jgi:hypothetical protein
MLEVAQQLLLELRSFHHPSLKRVDDGALPPCLGQEFLPTGSIRHHLRVAHKKVLNRFQPVPGLTFLELVQLLQQLNRGTGVRSTHGSRQINHGFFRRGK